MDGKDETEPFLMFRFPTYNEFVETTHHSNYQSSSDDSDDEFFDPEAEEEEDEAETMISNSAHYSVVVGDTENPLVNSEVEEICSKIGPKSENPERNVVNDDDDGSNFVKNLMEMNIETESNLSQPVKDDGHLFSDDEDDDSLVSDSDSDSMASSSKFTFRSSIMDSMSDGFLSDIDFEKAFDVDASMEFDGENANTDKVMTEEDVELEKLNRGYETEDFENEDEELLMELKNLEKENKKPRVRFILPNPEDDQNSKEIPNSGEEKGEKPNSGEQLSSDYEEQNKLESEWEHQDLVEQLKMEIKKVRSIGLPTILEESESPKITQDLKPWKIEVKFPHEDTVDELHKLYKIYRERMRKLDILNYQKMYAIGFLRLKDPLQSFTRQKMWNPAMAAIVSLDCWTCKGKSSTEVGLPVKKFSKELENELEMVYVGQMCLSWEFLRWEYGKALKLWDSDLHGIRRYNEVADKFQQFQVLLTRFLEDEPFQAPRVQYYVKTRCVLRNLLQVPLIQEDNLRDKKKERKWASNKDGITSVNLVEMMEESIRLLWQFIRSDKVKSNALLDNCRRFNVELQNPADAALFEQIRTNLQKKEKRLKELIKSENCILRKFQKHKQLQDETEHVSYFFSKVDLKLVSRVLNMSKITTDQLVWCSDKLNKINVVGGKLYVDPFCLLFPCS